MPKKAYSEADRVRVKRALLDTALEAYLQGGIRQVKLPDILAAVGISKPFFYTFYPSVGELVFAIIYQQYERLEQMLEQAQKKADQGWRAMAEDFLDQLIRYKEHGLLIMSPEEQAWIYTHVTAESYAAFQKRQLDFFLGVLRECDVPPDRCDAKVMANYILSMIIVRNNAEHALPFHYREALTDTARLQAKLILDYLETLRSV